ncbi:hypothetical protein FHX48_000695 [Microbacterium halimionae]|uniref:Uncharacterized protein n=1 Tax=Microbacterium halimionae TaxID=1526413 RepID=A0A7W3JMR6_9MICO|nr:hypothetical protein [Microbacterium halimionae]MBA8815643.1 hypothetical protein [Microbacterium halimionae]NII95690.1 hypothetical protein [Microbacterium halimionae]
MTISSSMISSTEETLREAPNVASTAYMKFNGEVMSAKSYENAQLLPSELRSERERRVARAQEAAGQEQNRLRAAAESAAALIRSVVEQERPRISDYARAQSGWQAATMYLDQGHSLAHILSRADESMTLAVEEYGVHWLQAQRDPAKLVDVRSDQTGDPVAAAVEQLHAMAALRLAELSADPALAAALRLSVQIDVYLVAAVAWWEGLSAIAANRTFNQLTAAVTARLVGNRAESQLKGLSPAETARQSA